MNEQEQLLRELTSRLELQNKELSQTKALLQQRERELKEANETIISWSQSDLTIERAEAVKKEASVMAMATENDRLCTEQLRRDLAQQQTELASSLEYLEQSQEALDEELEERDQKRRREYKARVARKVKSKVAAFTGGYALTAVYAAILTLLCLADTGRMADGGKMVDFLRGLYVPGEYTGLALILVLTLLPAGLLGAAIAIYIKKKCFSLNDIVAILAIAAVCLVLAELRVNVNLAAFFVLVTIGYAFIRALIGCKK